MQHEIEGDVDFHAQAHLVGFEKYNDKFCFLVLSNNNNLPEKISISKPCFENNFAVLKKANNNMNYDIAFRGKIKQRKGKFFFNVIGTVELVPTPEVTEEEMNKELERFFAPVREMKKGS